MHAKAILQLCGSMDHLRLVWQTGETLLEPVMFEEDCEGNRYNVLLAVQEMLTNVLRHGYELDEAHPVEVEFQVAADSFSVELRDQGPAFDPLALEVEDPALAIGAGEDLPDESGGFGIYIALMVMDELCYERRDGWNCLAMRKQVRVQAGT